MKHVYNRLSFSIFAPALLLTACGSASEDTSGTVTDSEWCLIDDPGITGGSKEDCPDRPDLGDLGEDVLYLPMPCGRTMILQRVVIEVNSPLDDEQMLFGDPNLSGTLQRTVSGPYWNSIGGGFSSEPDGTGESYYYIGRYEVSEPHFAIFASSAAPNCEGANATIDMGEPRSVRPITALSYDEARDFADHYTQWLIAEGWMPKKETASAFLRLPSEVEWEFAARGANTSATGTKIYEVPSDWEDGPPSLADIAWYNMAGQKPADGHSTYLIGRKAPNKLLLFDMLGNAGEMTSDIFRPVRPDGELSNRPGGIVTRGGSAINGKEGIGVGARDEFIPYLSDGPNRSDVIGFRLVLAAPFFVNRQGEGDTVLQGNKPLTKAIEASFKRMTQVERSAASARALAADRLNLLRSQLGEKFGTDIDAIETNLRLADARSTQREDASAEAEVFAAIMTVGYSRELDDQIQATRLQVEGMGLSAEQQTPEIRKYLKTIEENIARDEAQRNTTFQYYLRTIGLLAERPETQVRQAASQVRVQLAGAGLTELAGNVSRVEDQSTAMRRSPPTGIQVKKWRERWWGSKR